MLVVFGQNTPRRRINVEFLLRTINLRFVPTDFFLFCQTLMSAFYEGGE